MTRGKRVLLVLYSREEVMEVWLAEGGQAWAGERNRGQEKKEKEKDKEKENVYLCETVDSEVPLYRKVSTGGGPHPAHIAVHWGKPGDCRVRSGSHVNGR